MRFFLFLHKKYRSETGFRQQPAKTLRDTKKEDN